MAIRWSELQKGQVSQTLQRHPPESNRCDEAASLILPVARERDGAARTLSVRPRGKARFVVPKLKLQASWSMHFTVEVERHCVDALTGPEGGAKAEYLRDYWQYPDHLVLGPEEVPRVS